MYYTMFDRAYKYRLYPNKSQEDLLQKHFGHCRFIYNHFLAVKIKHYKETKKTLNWQDMATEHDRDINAAKNILDFSFPKTKFNTGRNYPIETHNYCGGNPPALAGG